jgi:hypothetical protein
MKTGKGRIFLLLSALLTVIAAGIVFFYYQPIRNATPLQRTAATEKDSISVFFPSGHGRLEKKVVEIPRHLSDKAKAEALFRGLKESRCIPDRLRLYDLAMGQDGVLYLNISKEFVDRTTPEREIAMTYGIVNSFIQSFRDAKSVQLLVEGAPIYTRSGLLYVFEPLQFNKDVMED